MSRGFMKNNAQKRSMCPINFALEEFGDIWSLLIVRDIIMFDKTTYGEFLSSPEHIATNILADRLEKLTANDIIKKVKDEKDKRKIKYQPTKKGVDLYPIMFEMMVWSAKYDNREPFVRDFLKNVDKERKQMLKSIKSLFPYVNPKYKS